MKVKIHFFLLIFFLYFAIKASDQVVAKVYKSKYLLEVYNNNRLTARYSTVFGNPKGDKMKQGDRKTPIGTFIVKDKYPHKDWAYFIWLDYPNKTSWAKFQERKAKGLVSVKDKIGGEIGIHGVPRGRDILISKRVNWTLGCISLTRADIAALYDLLTVGAVVEIYE